ncbi:LamG-like jellyroll fold domain-containing protein [Autumnicola psychrophila]|uniref:LamG-like jellyroll fold domain-containing protein n=1 Tax=Autumnicola psychrophila TaxID=3075592 RepID=A0ABU3DTG3_9FLAO|nr:LamG-like jellyroll fold domain-containing protein [Zunongwangia sp. F225]MDT0686980.1 LamG-like jellyroll fold domain-containing protein [Zunongwangia sp. F225]
MNILFFRRISLFYFLCCLFLFSCASSSEKAEIWKINSVSEIGGNPTDVVGNPNIVKTEAGGAVEFDGKKDGLLVDKNPIVGLNNFSIEVDFKPFNGYPENNEQRFLHIQDPENEARRILIELRLNSRNEWYGDWFIKTENQDLALIDSTLTHPVNEWATIRLTYENGQMKGFVNGKQQLTGDIEYLPIGENGRVSIGTRMDKRSWFKGLIKEVRFSEQAST